MNINVYEFFKRFSESCPGAKGCRIVGASGTQYRFDGFVLGKVKVLYENGDDTTIRKDCIVIHIAQESVFQEHRPFSQKTIRPVIHIAIDRSRSWS